MYSTLCIVAVATLFVQVQSSFMPDLMYFNGTCPHCSDGKVCNGKLAGTKVGCAGSDYYATCGATAATCVDSYCPAGLIWNNAKMMCTHCLTGHTWHPKEKVCHCAAGTGINKITHECVICGPSTVSKEGKCKCKNPNKFWNYHHTQKVPPHLAPHKCMDCPLTTSTFGDNCMCNKMSMWFDVMDLTKPCKPCPTGSMFSKLIGKCVCLKKGYIIAKLQKICVKAPNTPRPTLAFDWV